MTKRRSKERITVERKIHPNPPKWIVFFQNDLVASVKIAAPSSSTIQEKARNNNNRNNKQLG